MPKLSELGRLYYSKLDINPMELKNKKEIKNDNINIKNDNKISNTSYSNEIKFLYELKVFLFKKDDFIIINITPDEIIKMIKEKILIK